MEKDSTAIARLTKLFRHIDIRHRHLLSRGAAGTNLYRAQHMLLVEVYHNQGQTQSTLAKNMEVSTAAMAVALKKLEKGGYIRRETDENDNRYNHIFVTEMGKQIVEEHHRIFTRIDKAMFDGFSEEEKANLIALYERILGNISNIEQNLQDYLKEEQE